MSTDTLPAIKGLHHLKLPVSDLDRSLAFYERALGARRIAEYDHKKPDGTLYAYILDVPDLGTLLELRLDPKHAELQRRFDPFTMAVEDHATLIRWGEHLDALGIERSPEITGVVGWMIAFEDPDQHRLRFYTLERHGPELAPTTESPWLEN